MYIHSFIHIRLTCSINSNRAHLSVSLALWLTVFGIRHQPTNSPPHARDNNVCTVRGDQRRECRDGKPFGICLAVGAVCLCWWWWCVCSKYDVIPSRTVETRLRPRSACTRWRDDEARDGGNMSTATTATTVHTTWFSSRLENPGAAHAVHAPRSIPLFFFIVES